MLNKDRSNTHKRIDEVERTLMDLELLLKVKNEEAINDITSNLPNIYILGCARSGTTLLFQLLCKYLDVTYPTNFLSRFSYAPYLGAKIQYLMNELDNKGELLSAFSDFDLQSNLGKTKGPLSPHEFWYYWRSIFNVDKLGYVKNMRKKNIDKFHQGLDSIKSVFKKPMVLKGMIANTSISKIVKNRPTDIIIYIKRRTEYNAQSLYESRINYSGDANKWYSFGISNYDKFMPPLQEVVEQVEMTNKMIESELVKIPSSQIINLSYENINEEINSVFERISSKFSIDFEYPNLQEIKNQNHINLEAAEWSQLQKHVLHK